MRRPSPILRVLVAGLALFALAGGSSADPHPVGWPEVAPYDPRGGAEFRVREVARLRFGRVVANPRARGAVTLDPVTCSKRLNGAVTDLGGVHSCAEYVVRGEPNTRFTITLPEQKPLESGRGRALLTDFTSNPAHSGVIGPRGFVTVTVGATLLIEGAQPPGDYRGSYSVFLDFD